ncbi:MAG: FixH family protein [Xanthomonadaceae bacterium]|nr:FixH family protein [Xanthomonadaceae bacterium]MDP2185928.1 FixH family protein [Xanthomonadales bacterium]MDZ4115958.1 FixH family protein [Xanthomonadaceae bacterium]MDZ4378909.1 FixH family protein [Xanthomonadaceae bacterium]
MTTDSNHIRPWYREPMVWLMIALPAAVVIAGLSTVVIAVRASGDDAVPESVRRTAQMQVVDLAADQQAARRKLRAHVQVTRSTGAVQVSVSGDNVADNRLQLRFIHATDGAHDALAMLVRSGDGWLGRVDAPLDHPWALILSADDDAWRLQGHLPTEHDSALLEPALAGE